MAIELSPELEAKVRSASAAMSITPATLVSSLVIPFIESFDSLQSGPSPSRDPIKPFFGVVHLDELEHPTAQERWEARKG